MVVKGEPLITDPMWCVHLKFIPLDVPMKSFQVGVVTCAARNTDNGKSVCRSEARPVKRHC